MTKREYYRLVCAMIRDGHRAYIERVAYSPLPPNSKMRPVHFALCRLALRNTL